MDILFTIDGKKAAVVFSDDYMPSDRALDDIKSLCPDAEIVPAIGSSNLDQGETFYLRNWGFYFVKDAAP